MGAKTADIFGVGIEPQLALPGSYGQAPTGYRLPDATRLGQVRLQVRDLERSLKFYVRVLGLRVVERSERSAAFAAHGDDRVLVRLEESEGIAPAQRARLGLYHFAILVPDRASLGRFVQHLADCNWRAGAGDHLVSEAFYLADPDGLGIEVYADRPRASWQRIGRELMLATDAVDVTSLMAAAGDEPWSGMPAGTQIGHVHLHVGDLTLASVFYSEGLGFDRMTWSYPGALFFGAGGYHHHLGTNIWAGAQARPASKTEARLLEWTIEVPTTADVREIAERLTCEGCIVASPNAGGAIATDPWGTRVRIAAV